MKKCYDKRLEYVVPKIKCSFCHNQINTGDELHRVILTWGNGKTACKKCADEYEIDWSMYKRENEDDDELEILEED